MKHHDKLSDYVFVIEKFLPQELCKYTIDNLKSSNLWEKHKWYNSADDESWSHQSDELDIHPSAPELDNLYYPYIQELIDCYFSKYKYENFRVSKVSQIRFNRYQSGQFMRPHCDLIRSIFDGQDKGVPVFSIILNLSNDYKGGDFKMWGENIVPLDEGCSLIFPSTFLDPHEVTPVIRGTRYSAVAWAY